EHIDRRRQDLHQTDVIEPRSSRWPVVVLEPYRRRPVGLDHDRTDLIRLPVVRSTDDLRGPPGIDAARPKVDRQPSTARRATAETIRLDPRAEEVRSGLQLHRLGGGIRTRCPSITDAAGMHDQ